MLIMMQTRRYADCDANMQSLDMVFEAREKKAERQLQKKADRQAAKLKAKEAEQQANPTCAKPSKGSQKHTTGMIRAP